MDNGTMPSLFYSDDKFTAVRVGQPVTHMKSTNSKPQRSNQFQMDKIKSCTYVLQLFLFEKPFNSNVHHNKEEKTFILKRSTNYNITNIQLMSCVCRNSHDVHNIPVEHSLCRFQPCSSSNGKKYQSLKSLHPPHSFLCFFFLSGSLAGSQIDPAPIQSHLLPSHHCTETIAQSKRCDLKSHIAGSHENLQMLMDGSFQSMHPHVHFQKVERPQMGL